MGIECLSPMKILRCVLFVAVTISTLLLFLKTHQTSILHAPSQPEAFQKDDIQPSFEQHANKTHNRKVHFKPFLYLFWENCQIILNFYFWFLKIQFHEKNYYNANIFFLRWAIMELYQRLFVEFVCILLNSSKVWVVKSPQKHNWVLDMLTPGMK